MDNSPSIKTLKESWFDLPQDWRSDRKAENVKFYAGNIQRVTILPGKERTTRKSICDVCLTPQQPGIRLFFLTGSGCHKFHICESCWTDLIEATTVNALMVL